jgi:hypothetical protein
MTDRLIAFTVTLQRPTREDDAESIKDAISMIKGVAKVVPVVADAAAYMAMDTAYRKVRERVYRALEPEMAARMDALREDGDT